MWHNSAVSRQSNPAQLLPWRSLCSLHENLFTKTLPHNQKQTNSLIMKTSSIVPCPRCGASRTITTCVKTAGSFRIRHRHCKYCPYKCKTIQQILPVVRPEETEPSTKDDWRIDSYKSRFLSGKNSRSCKLTRDNVKQIRILYKTGYLKSELTKIYGVGLGTLNNILAYRSWKYVE